MRNQYGEVFDYLTPKRCIQISVPCSRGGLQKEKRQRAGCGQRTRCDLGCVSTYSLPLHKSFNKHLPAKLMK